MKRLSAFLTLIVVLAFHGGAASFGSTEIQGWHDNAKAGAVLFKE